MNGGWCCSSAVRDDANVATPLINAFLDPGWQTWKKAMLIGRVAMNNFCLKIEFILDASKFGGSS
jgi:hypothetical protein